MILFIGVFGIFCWLSPTRAHALPATAVSLTALDGQQTVLTSDADADTATYSWDCETSTLTLKGYSGRSISTNGDINLHLVGNNTLTLDPEQTGSSAYGLNLDYTSGTATVTAEEGGTLNIVGDIKTHFSAVSGGAIFISGTFNIDVTTSSNGTLYAFERNVSFDNDGSGKVAINIDIERTSDATSFIYGFYNGFNMTGRRNVSINLDLKGSENDTVIGFTDIYVVKSSPKIIASVDNKGGYFKYRKAIGSINALSLTEGGRVELCGVVGMYSIGGGSSDNTVTTTPQNNNYIWIEYDGKPFSSNDYILSTLDGNICEHTVFEYQESDAPLKWVGEGIISIPAGKVDDNVSVNILSAVRGLSSYDAYYIKCEVLEGKLPEGIYAPGSGGLINGQFASPCDAGSVTLRLTERNDTYYDLSDDRTIDITLNYGAVADKDRFITVGNSDPVNLKSDGSGAGWSYDGDSGTLTLNGYNGGPITTEGILNLHLKGNNTVTLTNEKTIGIESTHSTGEINLTADAGGTLNIKTPASYTKSFTGIKATVTMSGGTVNMDLASDFTGVYDLYGYGLHGYVGFTDSGAQKTWNVNLKNNGDPAVIGDNKVTLYGNYNNSIRVENCSDVEMNIDIRGSEYTEIHGIYSIHIYESSPKITVYTDNQNGEKDCLAIDGLVTMILTEGGRLDLTGGVRANGLPYGQSPHTVTTTPQNNNYYWKDVNSNYSHETFLMTDLEGNTLDRVVYEYSAEPADLKWVGGSHFNIPAGAVGDYFGFNLWAGIRGGSSPSFGSTNWSFEIIEGKLPSGIDFSDYPIYNGKIEGQISAPCVASSARIRATDKMGTNDTADDRSIEFTISYGAFTTNNPVNGLNVNKNSIVIENNGTGEITATVTPSDAAYPYVVAIPVDGAKLILTVGEPVNGVSSITVQPYGDPGVYSFTVRTVELGIEKNVTVYVKEASPKATVDYYKEWIRNLELGATYKISGEGVTTYQFTAEEEYLAIPEQWIGKTLNIVKVSGENGDCDSTPQILLLPARPAAPTGVTKKDAMGFDTTDGAILNLENGMQYKSADVDNWSYYWTPTIYVGVGSYNVRYAATESAFASEAVTLTVGYGKVVFEDRDSFDIPAGNAETTWSNGVSFGVSGGKKPYSYSIEAPSWITIDEDGVISVIRPKADLEATTATVTVTDADGNSASITINVGAVIIPHVCKYDQQVTTSDYRISSADCVNKAKYYYSCTCGRLGNTTFEYGVALGHNYVEKIVDEAHLRAKAADCQSFDTYWYDCTRCSSISGDKHFSTQTRGEHKYSQSFEYRVPEGHAHVCTVQGCGAIDSTVPHTAGPAATETEPQTCTVCSFVINPALGHTHTADDRWSSDSNSHWHNCVGNDGYRFDSADHLYDKVCDKDCNICGAVRVPTSHSEEAVWISNADTHQKKYNCCGTVLVEAEGHTWQGGVCTDCGYECLHSADNDLNHKCDICEESIGVHQAAAGTHICYYCGGRLSYCTDGDLDHKCDVCGASVGTHDSAKGEHNCGYCGKPVTYCSDLDRDHLCDECGETVGEHKAALGKHTCDYCEKTVSQCTDADLNGKCDICGGDVEIPEAPENPDLPEKPVTPDEPEKGLKAGAVVAIVIGSVLVVGVGGYSVMWFVVGKKTFADLVAVFKEKNFTELLSVFKKNGIEEIPEENEN